MEVTSYSSDASLITVRQQKRMGYLFEIETWQDFTQVTH
jgi:hypothetical protein